MKMTPHIGIAAGLVLITVLIAWGPLTGSSGSLDLPYTHMTTAANRAPSTITEARQISQPVVPVAGAAGDVFTYRSTEGTLNTYKSDIPPPPPPRIFLPAPLPQP